MYIVNIIEYEDDYKHRHDSGVYPHSPKIFETYDLANEYVLKIIDEMVKLKIIEYYYSKNKWDKKSLNKDYKDFNKYYKIDKEDIILKKNVLYDELIETFLKGEYVDYVITVDINECNLISSNKN